MNEQQTADTKKRKIISVVLFLVCVLFVAGFIYFSLHVTHYSLTSSKVNSAGFRCAVVSDLHSCEYGHGENNLVIAKLAEENPDFVLMPGDIFDDIFTDENSCEFLETLVKKYPCYYVTGNHEFWSDRPDEIKEYLESIGVVVLEGDCSTIEINGNLIDILGVDDPVEMSSNDWLLQLDRACEASSPDNYRILVSHRPELVDDYNGRGLDLIVAGHAHGGQITIPFVNVGVYAPNQGLFPKYIGGDYVLPDGGNLIVSRGLCRERIPFPRLNNFPEIVIIDVGN